jgi:hydrogenase nickel incorporation protein HypA/HybF
MHEFSMTTQIVQAVLYEVKKHNAKKVKEVHVIIGKLTYLGVDQIRFAYKILIEDTILKGSKLFIEEREGKIKCPNCKYKGNIPLKDDPAYHIPIPTLRCPECNKAANIIEGKECTIKSIKMVK